MQYLQLGQYALASLEIFGVDHKQLGLYSNPIWASSDTTVISTSPSAGNPGYVSLRGLRTGTSELSADGTFDTGKGIKQSHFSDTIEVIDGEVAYGEIKLIYGEVVPISPVKSTETKSKPK